MARERDLMPLLGAAALLLGVGLAFLVAPSAFLRPCPGPEDHGFSPAPSPGPAAAAGGKPAVCLHVARAVVFVAGALTGSACVLCCDWWFAVGGDEEEDEDEASGAAEKAGYAPIADDPEAGAGAGGKN